MTNLVSRLRALARAEHDDLIVASEAADILERPAHEREPPHCPTCSCGAEPTPEPEHSHLWSGTSPDAFCIGCGMLQRNAENRSSTLEGK